MPSSSRRVVVVGCGVFGATAALELARRGWEVTVVDPGPLPHPDASSTDISKVVRMDYGIDDFYQELAGEALEGWDRWNRRWPQPLYHQDGFLLLSAGEMAPGGFEYESHRTLTAHGHQLRRLRPGEVAEAFPQWQSRRYPDGYVNPRAGWAESGRVVARLVTLAVDAGVQRVQGTVMPLDPHATEVRSVRLADGRVVEADQVVVAGGAWTPHLVPWLNGVLWATAQPVLHLGVDDPTAFQPPRFPPWAADIAGSGWYGFPALDDGRLKIGHHGAGQRVDSSRRGTVAAEHVARCRAFLAEAIPALAEAPVVGERVCLYCDSFDGDFVVDRDPERPGLVVVSGGSGHGFKFAPVLGGLAADVLEGRDNRWLHRFRWREAGAVRTEDARFDG